ncbi:Putative sensor protein (fragment) [Hyella patelloides LEGE 07179]|uniref:Sensor protein n=1 Tax=Hyella patelloides LEGE 07179 TaxID=945734 RepID=A0A563VY09_9CYAN
MKKSFISGYKLNEKFQLPQWSVLVISIVIALTTSASIYRLNRWTEQSNYAQVLLVKMAEQLSKINALEWEAIALKKFSSEEQEELTEIREEIEFIFSELKKIDRQNNQLNYIANLYEQYDTAINQEIEFIQANQIEKAIAIDREIVDPIYDYMSEEITTLGEIYLLK